MNLIWRFFWVILFSRFEKPLNILDESSITFRVLPTDVDLLMHMNNGRYFSLLDLARINLISRSGVLARLEKNRIYPVVASEMIRFRKSLRLFQRFEISTKIIGWDEMFYYIIHHFKVGNDVYALCIVKARMLRKGGGKVSPSELATIIGMNPESPPIPDWIQYWQRADKEFYDDTIND